MVSSYISNWPGKSARDGQLEHPAVYHMIDVAAVAEVLLAPHNLSQDRKAALVLLVCLHDLGKVGDSFRSMIRDGVSQGVRHWELTEIWLQYDTALRNRLGANDHVWRELVAAIAGHHGQPSVRDEKYFATYRAAAGIEAARDAPEIAADLNALWPHASLAGMKRAEAQRLSWWLSGLTVAADWVGSNPDWFPAQPPDMSLPDYLEHSRIKAKHAVKEARLLPARLQDGELFDFDLRPMQIAAQDIPCGDEPKTVLASLGGVGCSPCMRG